MPDAYTIERESADVIRLGGALTFASTPAMYSKLKDAFDQGDVSHVDLEAVERADSAGLGLLLEWQATIGRRGRKVRFTNAPDMLMSLARLCEADEVLDMQGRREQA
jgi:anti-anti-sigma factor